MSIRETVAEDLKAVCLNPDDFGVEAIYTALGGTRTKKVNGIFRDKFKDATLYRNVADVGDTVFICAIADVGAVETGAAFLINGTTYYKIRDDYNKLNGKAVIGLSENNPL